MCRDNRCSDVGENFSDQMGSIAINRAVWITIDAKNPFAADGRLVGRGRDEIPGPIANESIKFGV